MPRPNHQSAVKTERFWKWFHQNEERIFNFERDREPIFNDLMEHLIKVHPDLCFEFSNVRNGKRQFVISAGGILDAFPAVIALKDSAPVLAGFYVTAFRQRESSILSVTMGGTKVDPEEVFVNVEPDGEKLGLLVLMKGVECASDHGLGILKQAMYLFLDQSLGEYDVETRISWIKLVDLSSHEHLSKHPISQLSEIVDRYFS